MEITTTTLQAIKLAQDSRLLHDDELRDLASMSAFKDQKFQVRIEVPGTATELDAALEAQGFTFDLNCETLAKWANSIEKTYGKAAMLAITLLPQRDQIEFKIGTSSLRLNRKGVHLGEAIKLSSDGNLLTYSEVIDRDAMKTKRKALAHTRKIAATEKRIIKLRKAVAQAEDAVASHEKRVDEAFTILTAQTLDEALNEAKAIRLYRRKLAGLKALLGVDYKAGYSDLLGHDAPADLLDTGTWAVLGDVQFKWSEAQGFCPDSDCDCALPHEKREPVTRIEYGRDRYATAFGRYTEARNKLHRMKVNWRLSSAQQKKADDFRRAAQQLLSEVESIYRTAIEEKHNGTVAGRVFWHSSHGTYAEARRIARKADEVRERLYHDLTEAESEANRALLDLDKLTKAETVAA